jgi:hypothetical protein
MKKTAKIRLSLSRETLRTLDANELEAAPGGANSNPFCLITNPCITQSCPTRCGGSCSATTQTC